MNSTRTPILAVAVVTGAIGLALIACSSSTTTGTGDGGTGGSSGGASGNSSGGASGNNTSGGASGSNSSGFKDCSTAGSGASSNCKNGELETYSQCVMDKCDADYQKCFGANYKQGTFSGPCGTYITCTNACACDDTACRQACVMGSECQTCATGFATCSQSCTLPSCATGGSSGAPGGKTCADLQACCDAKSGSAKTQCQGALDSIKAGGNAACNAVYASVCQ